MAQDWNEKAIEHARDTADNFLEELVEQAMEDVGDVDSDLRNYYAGGDEFHHCNNVDIDYDLLEAAEVLDRLRNHEERDSSLWEGLEPRRAVCVQAAYTFGNAVYWHWQRIVENIQDDLDLGSLREAEVVWDSYDEDLHDWNSLDDQEKSESSPPDVPEEPRPTERDFENRVREIIHGYDG